MRAMDFLKGVNMTDPRDGKHGQSFSKHFFLSLYLSFKFAYVVRSPPHRVRLYKSLVLLVDLCKWLLVFM